MVLTVDTLITWSSTMQQSMSSENANVAIHLVVEDVVTVLHN